ncbi:inorganic phosphate transporter [Cupriavidus basilensis]
MMVIVAWTFLRTPPSRVDRWFRRLQLISASLYSLGHGGNDAQKTIGIIWMLLIASGHVAQGGAEPPIVGHRFLLCGDRHGYHVRWMAHRAYHGPEDYQAQAGRRLLRGDRWRDHAVHRLRSLGDAGVDHAHHHAAPSSAWARRRKMSAPCAGVVAGNIVWAWVLTISGFCLHGSHRA